MHIGKNIVLGVLVIVLTIVGLFIAEYSVVCAQVKEEHPYYPVHQPKAFPTEKEIQKLCVDVDKAVDAFHNAALFQKKVDPEMSQKSMKIVDMIVGDIALIEREPLRFNSPLGYHLIYQLNEASYITLWCAGDAEQRRSDSCTSQQRLNPAVSDIESVCTKATMLLLNVQDETAVLYAKYLVANDKLQAQEEENLKEAEYILKQAGKESHIEP